MPPDSPAAASAAIGSAQPVSIDQIGVGKRTRDEVLSRSTTTSAEQPQATSSPCAKLRAVISSQVSVAADRAEADRGAGDQPVRRGLADSSRRLLARAEIEFATIDRRPASPPGLRGRQPSTRSRRGRRWRAALRSCSTRMIVTPVPLMAFVGVTLSTDFATGRRRFI